MGCGMELTYFLKSDSGSLSYLAKDHMHSIYFHFASYHRFQSELATKIVACVDFWYCEGEHKVSIVGSCWERITGQKLSI